MNTNIFSKLRQLPVHHLFPNNFHEYYSMNPFHRYVSNPHSVTFMLRKFSWRRLLPVGGLAQTFRRGTLTHVSSFFAILAFLLLYLLYRMFLSREAAHLIPENSTATPPKTKTEGYTVIVRDSASVKSSRKSLWEEPTLHNLTNFMWILNNEALCETPKKSRTNQQLKLIPILIHSDKENVNEREVIRNSWISVRDTYKGWSVVPVFLIGEEDPNVAINELLEEHQRFGDIIVGNFIDTFRNLTYKHLMGYKWVLNFCKDATFVIKTDDNFFIDILRWLDWRSEDIRNKEANASISDLYCLSFTKSKPIRIPTNQFYVSVDEYPEAFYPDYCSGHAYGITVEAIRMIYSVSNKKKFVPMDNVQVTGILRREAEKKFGWKPILKDLWPHVTTFAKLWRPFCEEDDESIEHWNKEKCFREIVQVPRENFERDLMCLWKKVLYDRMLDKILERINLRNLSFADL